MPLLDRILAASVVALSDLTGDLERGAVSAAVWERQMEALLARHRHRLPDPLRLLVGVRGQQSLLA